MLGRLIRGVVALPLVAVLALVLMGAEECGSDSKSGTTANKGAGPGAGEVGKPKVDDKYPVYLEARWGDTGGPEMDPHMGGVEMEWTVGGASFGRDVDQRTSGRWSTQVPGLLDPNTRVVLRVGPLFLDESLPKGSFQPLIECKIYGPKRITIIVQIKRVQSVTCVSPPGRK